MITPQQEIIEFAFYILLNMSIVSMAVVTGVVLLVGIFCVDKK